jgi:hypothetical protein
MAQRFSWPLRSAVGCRPGRDQYHLLALNGVERSGRIKALRSANELNNLLKLGGTGFGRDLVDTAEGPSHPEGTTPLCKRVLIDFAHVDVIDP